MKLILTCEHAGNHLPEQFRELFQGSEEVLTSHRGYDLGAYSLYKKLKPLAYKSFSNKWSRLVVEVNRSIGHAQLFSEFTKPLPKEVRKDLLQNYYFSYRNEVEENITAIINSGKIVLHFSIHSFTPELAGKIRNTDIGLLYDPARKVEKRFCREFRGNLQKKFPKFKIRFNYPYKGKSDGFTTYFRKKFPNQYLGIEIELNQNLLQKGHFSKDIERGIFEGLQKTFT